jgi:pimeloyl-ACP methyl ester carboxylesterase
VSTIVKVGDGRLAVAERGHGDTVLLIHGAVFADGMTPLLGEPALTANYTVVDYKRRGYGRSSPVETDAGIHGHADDMAALLDARRESACHLLAHSYGGYIALEFAARYPGRVRSLTLIEPGPLMAAASAPALVSGLTGLEALFRNGAAGTVVEIFLQTLNGAVYRERLGEVLPPAWDEAAQTALRTYFDYDVPAALAWQFGPQQAAAISAPSLVMVGSDSPAVFHETRALLLDWLPRVETVELGGLAHCPHWFDAPRVAAQVAHFLASAPRL